MQKKTLDLVGIGECLVEFAEVEPGLYRQDYSGDVLNTLWMASTLGLHTGLISSVGDDPFTEGLRRVLLEGRIDASLVRAIHGRPNGIYYVLDRNDTKVFHFIRKGSAATQTFAQDEGFIRDYILRSRSVIFSAIPLATIEHRDVMLSVLHEVQGRTTIAFDTNVRKALWPDLADLRSLITSLSSMVDILFVSKDDDEALFGERSSTEATEYYRDLGYTTVIYRRGSESTVACTAEGSCEISTVPNVAVLDPTGAGDAFNAAFITATLEGQPLAVAVRFANAAAATVLGVHGGRALGITREKIQNLMDTVPKEAHA